VNLATDEAHETIVILVVLEIQEIDKNLSVISTQKKFVSYHACEDQ
jgi:hypothetical protein